MSAPTIRFAVMEKNKTNELFFDSFGSFAEVRLFFPFELNDGEFCWEDNYGADYVNKKTVELVEFLGKTEQFDEFDVTLEIKDNGVILKMAGLDKKIDAFDFKYQMEVLFFSEEAKIRNEDYSVDEIVNDYNKSFFMAMESYELCRMVYLRMLNDNLFEDFFPLMDVAR